MFNDDLDQIEKEMGEAVKDHGVTVHASIVLLVLAVRLLLMISRRMIRDGGEG